MNHNCLKNDSLMCYTVYLWNIPIILNSCENLFRYDLAQAEVERGKYLLADQDLKTREDQWQDERTFMAKVRADKEYKYAHDAERLKINAER